MTEPNLQPRFLPAVPRRAFDEIVGQLRDMVRTGQLQTGDRLPSEREMAEQFRVSRNTVREALRMLEISGLVKLKKGASGGAFISEAEPSVVVENLTDMLSLSRFSLSDLTEVRLWLSTLVVRCACERMGDEDFDRLEHNIREASTLARRSDWAGKLDVNLEFFDLLAAATANPLIVLLHETVAALVRDILTAVGPTANTSVTRFHQRLLRALRARDPEAAVAEVERHLTRVHHSWLTGTRTSG